MTKFAHDNEACELTINELDTVSGGDFWHDVGRAIIQYFKDIAVGDGSRPTHQ